MTRIESAGGSISPPLLPPTLVEVLCHHAANRPRQRAFTFLRDGEIADSQCTFAELDSRVRSTAALLQRLPGCHAGARVLLLLPTGIDYIVGFFACLYAGLVAVPCYPPRRERLEARLLAIIADADVALILSTSEILGNLREGIYPPALPQVQMVALDTLHKDLPPVWQPPPLSGDSLAFLQYTSGSTGIPKGVMVSHGNLIHNAELQKRAFAHDDHTVYVNWPPLFHDMGLIGNVIQSVYVGVHCVLMTPAAFAQKPYRWLKAISDYRATTSGGPNFAYDLCVRKISDEQLRTLDLRSWTTAYNGAEPIRNATLQAFSRRFAVCGFRPESFHSCYGMAETTLLVSSGPRDRFPRVFLAQPDPLQHNRAVPAADPARAISIVSCGRPWPGVDLRIVDPHRFRPCADGEIGEVWVASKDVTQGYWNRPAATGETFAAHLAETGEGPFLRTGDLGFLDEGEFYFAGRHKDLIIIRGQNYHPSDLELTAGLCHPALHSGHGAAFSIELDGEERLVVAHEVVRSAQEGVDIAAVAAPMRRAIAEHHGLTLAALAILPPGSLPRTSSGKIQRRQCRELFLAGKLSNVGIWRPTAAVPVEKAPRLSSAASAAAAPDTMDWLRRRVAEILHLDASSLDIEQPFSAYGLDSTSAAGLSGELAERLGRRLGATLLYDYPSIAALVAQLHPAGEAAAVPGTTPVSGPLPCDEAIAVIGMACRFPGAEDPAAFWQLLERGGDAIRPLPAARRHLCGFPDTLSPWGGFLDDIEQFDADCFAIAPREAAAMDPQQRLLLEVSWQAFEDAGLAPIALRGSRTGVFIGICSNDYLRLQTAAGRMPDAWSGTGNSLSIAANRISYVYDLRGPSKAIDTACSSSLVALHDACRSLLARECEVALAGGVHLCLAPDLFLAFDAARMIAKGGRCRTFDAGAEGYVRGEGCGVLLLKRLSAVAAGERVLGLIKGSAVNQDGRSNGLTAPNGPAQQDVMGQALRAARIAPAAVGHVEAHGTGTPLGDPIEMTALHAVYGAGESPCFVGSVKTNIGHLEAAAGVAGVIKSILLLTHRTIPRHLHFTQLNPAITLESSRLRIATAATPWPQAGEYAVISSFGFGGTNAHLILAPPPPAAAPPRRATAPRPFQRQRHWFELPAEPPPQRVAARPAIHPLLGALLWTANSNPNERLFAAELSASEPAFLSAHRIVATPLLPAAAYLESALAAARQDHGNARDAAGAPLVLSAVRIEQPLVLSETVPQHVQLILTREPPASASSWSFQILSLAHSDAAPRFLLHATGRIALAATPAAPSGPPALPLAALRARCPQSVPVAECYLRYRQFGLVYGPAFAALAELWRGPAEVLARLQLPASAVTPGDAAYTLHPVLLDAGFQALGVLVPAPASGEHCVVPVGLERLQLWRTTQLPAWAIARLHDGDSGPGRYRGDVQLLDEDGQVLCSIEGLILQAVDRHALLGQSPDSAAEPNSTVPAAAAGPAPPPAELEAPVRRQLADLPTESARRQALDELLQDELRRVLHLPASAVIPADRGFFDMGLDSLMATEIRNRLQHQLGVLLPPTVMFKFTTAAELSEHLHELLARTPQLAVAVPPAATPSPAVATAPAQGPAAEDAYARVAQLSEDELAALIDAKLKRFSE